MPNDSLLHHANNYRFTRWYYEGKKFHLDPTKENVLLLEMVERQVRATSIDTSYLHSRLGVVSNKSLESETDFHPL